MQRQPRSQTRDTSPLKQIKRNRISQLPGFPKIIKPEPYPLINISIDTLVNTPRAITEQIFQVSGKSSPDNPPLGIRPFRKELVGKIYSGRPSTRKPCTNLRGDTFTRLSFPCPATRNTLPTNITPRKTIVFHVLSIPIDLIKHSYSITQN